MLTNTEIAVTCSCYLLGIVHTDCLCCLTLRNNVTSSCYILIFHTDCLRCLTLRTLLLVAASDLRYWLFVLSSIGNNVTSSYWWLSSLLVCGNVVTRTLLLVVVTSGHSSCPVVLITIENIVTLLQAAAVDFPHCLSLFSLAFRTLLQVGTLDLLTGRLLWVSLRTLLHCYK